jgi:hypothetical protein
LPYGFDFHSVKLDQSNNVERRYVAGGLVLDIDWHNAPHPVDFPIEAETGCYGVKHKTGFTFLNNNKSAY